MLLLSTGHVVYSIAGFFVYADLLWVFNKIPYARPDSIYGSGALNHFGIQLYYVLGLPLYVLVSIGCVLYLVSFLRRTISREDLILICLAFAAFFTAHTLFWYLGIFNSMGLKRVFVGVAPLMALLGLRGFNGVADFFKSQHLRRLVKALLVVAIVVFPFVANPAAIKRADLTLTTEQKVARETAGFLEQLNSTNRLVYFAPYLSELLNIDHFDHEKRMELNRLNLERLKSGDIIVWDNWYAALDGDIPDTTLLDNHELELITTKRVSKSGSTVIYNVYRKL
jgi:hypothetical protein